MQTRIHMRDQVGGNKVEELMHHYDDDYYSMIMWSMKFMVIGGLLVGLYW
jgi:hypothetical protein